MSKTTLSFTLLALLTMAMVSCNLFFGAINIPPHAVFDALFHSSGDGWAFIVMESRLPQAITALLCGSALAISGLLLQTAFSNPLADPAILGVNSGAGLGVAIVMLLLGGSFTNDTFSLSGFILIITAAFIGATLVIMMLLFFSSILRSNLMLLIIGIMISYITSSVISLLNYTSTAEGVHSYVIWGLGNFSGIARSQLPAFAITIGIGLICSLALIKPLNALLLGENYATNLGINTQRTRIYLLATTGILTATTTAFCGPISFLGLAVPHMARLVLNTSDHRKLVPFTLLCGGNVALFCNLICNLPGDKGIIPLNVITPILGVPIILYVILFSKERKSFL